MKRLTLLILILLLGTSLGAQNPSSLVLFEFSATEGKSDEGRTLFEGFRVRLINSRAFTILEGSRVSNILVLNKILPGSRISAEKAGDLGRQLKADYALVGHYTDEGTKALLRLELIFCVTGKSLLVRDIAVTGKTLEAAEFDSFTAKVLDSKTSVESLNLQDVEALMKAGKYPEALKALGTFVELRSETPDTQKLDTQIRKKLGELAFADAGRLVGKYLFEEALLKMNEALFYEKDNQTYIKYLETMRQKQAAFGQTKKADAKGSLDKLLGEERWDSAQLLLNALSQRKILDTEVVDYQDKINKGKLEAATYQEALRDFWGRKYASALNKVNEIILMNPSKAPYQELKQKILSQQKDQGAQTAQWEAYKSSWENIDWFSLVGQKKLPSGFDQGLGIIPGNYFLTSKNDMNQTEQLPYLGLDFKLQWQFSLPFQLGIEFTELQWFLEAGVTGGLATKDNQSTYTDPITLATGPYIKKVLAYDAQVYGGAGFEILLFSFGLGLHTGPFTGVFSRSEFTRNVIKNSDGSYTGAIYDLGWYLTPSLGWSLDPKFRLTFQWPIKWFLLRAPTENVDLGDLRSVGFLVGFHYNFIR